MKKYSFTKMNGAGNDFIVFDKDMHSTLELRPEIIKYLCDRRFGIGGDGIIFVSKCNDADFEMIYYNSDGSLGSLCGNGARCAIKFAHLKEKFTGRSVKFKVNALFYTGEIVNSDTIKFFLNPPTKFKFNFKIKAFNQLINAHYVDTGSPHVVININEVQSEPKNMKSCFKDIAEFPVFELGKEIRDSRDFAPAGTNVNFIQILDQKVFIRTYERGVENETLACGTGSAASALICYTIYGIPPPVYLVSRSGDELIVDFNVENQKVKELSLTGPAKVNFTGELNITNEY